jgi:trimeric autotransporter adhesin
MSSGWLRNLVLPLALLVAVVALGYYLFKVREGFAAGDPLTGYALAVQNRSLADNAATQTMAASTNVNGLMTYLSSFATGVDNLTKATQIGTRLTLLQTDLGSARDAITAANTTLSDATTNAATLAAKNSYSAVDLALSGASGVTPAITALIALLNSAASTSGAISDQMVKVNTAATGLVSAMQPLLANVILAAGAAANSTVAAATAEVSAAQSKNTKAAAAVTATTQVGTDIGGLLAAINAELAKTTPSATNITALSTTCTNDIATALEKINLMNTDLGNKDTTAAEATGVANTDATNGVTGLTASYAGIQTAISSLTTAMGIPAASYPAQVANIGTAITGFVTNYNPIKTKVNNALSATQTAVDAATAVAASATATAAVTAAQTKNTMAAIAAANVAVVQADLTSLNATLTLDAKTYGNDMRTDIPNRLKKLQDDFGIMAANIKAADDNRGNNDANAKKTSAALQSSVAAAKDKLDGLATVIEGAINFLTSTSFSPDVVSKNRAAVQSAVSALVAALTNLKINADAAAAAAATAAGAAAATPATAAAAATTATTTTTDASGSTATTGYSGLGALFSSDFLNKFSDAIMTNSNASVNVEWDYQGDKGKWFDYLSQEHKDAVAAQQAAAAAAAQTAENQNKLLNNMGKATASKVYYDDSKECEDEPSPCTQQGKELTNAKKGMKCPTIDTNQYVRKDSVPCWGCDLE